MIYTDVQLKEKITCLINEFESEVVEFKEAKTNYSFNKIGKYFSALSNEANIRGFQEAWLVFGISNDKKFTGTEFRKQGGLQNLKKELVNGTNERLTFLEIYPPEAPDRKAARLYTYSGQPVFLYILTRPADTGK